MTSTVRYHGMSSWSCTNVVCLTRRDSSQEGCSFSLSSSCTPLSCWSDMARYKSGLIRRSRGRSLSRTPSRFCSYVTVARGAVILTIAKARLCTLRLDDEIKQIFGTTSSDGVEIGQESTINFTEFHDKMNERIRMLRSSQGKMAQQGTSETVAPSVCPNGSPLSPQSYV